MDEKNINDALYELRKKYWIQRFLKSIAYGICCFGVTMLLLIVISHFHMIMNIRDKGLGLMAVYLFIALVMGLVKRPTIKETARLGDAMDFRERFGTYIQHKEREDTVWYCFLEETGKVLKIIKPHKRFRIRFYKKQFFLGMMSFCIAILLLYLPTTSREAAHERERINQEIKKEVTALEEMMKILEENEITLGEEEKNEAIEAVQVLKKELNRAYQYNEAAWEIQKTQEILEGIYGKSFSNKEANSFSREISNLAGKENSSKGIDKEGTGHEEENMLEHFSDPQQRERLWDDMDVKTKELEEMKQRMLSKAEEGLESKSGEDVIENFAQGTTETLERAEATRQLGEERLEGGFGEENSQENSGIGGSTTGKQSDTGFKEEGSIGKEGEDSPMEEAFVEAAFSGQESEKGNFQRRGIEETIGIEGIEESRSAYYREFVENPMGYLDRYKVSAANRRLVINYFKELEVEN